MQDINLLISNQMKLFSSAPKRSEVISLKLPPTETYKINVHRNHTFENISNLIDKYFSLTGKAIEWVMNEYDDSLLFATRVDSDLDLIWLDLFRYNLPQDQLRNFLTARLEFLAKLSKHVICFLIGDSANDLLYGVKLPQNVTIFYVNTLLSENVEEIIDTSREKLVGSKLSSSKHFGVSKIIGGQILPFYLGHRLKAVVFDLDNTLYKGILGEDGIDGVQVKQFAPLYEEIKRLKQKGFFLALASKNDPEIVNEFFKRRAKELSITPADFTLLKISWKPKSESIAEIANHFRISSDTLLFVDDNPSELLEVGLNTGIRNVIFSGRDPSEVADAIKNYPGLWKPKILAEDALRDQDLVANDKRASLLATSEDEYFKQLDMKIKFDFNNPEFLSRYVEMSNKTNQFNLSFSRLNEVQMAMYLESSSYDVISVSLKDSITESGIIGLLVVEKKSDELIVHELAVSCRALGRKIEDALILSPIFRKYELSGISKIIFRYNPGPRNEPLVKWLTQLGVEADFSTTREIAMSFSGLKESFKAPPVSLEYQGV